MAQLRDSIKIHVKASFALSLRASYNFFGPSSNSFLDIYVPVWMVEVGSMELWEIHNGKHQLTQLIVWCCHLLFTFSYYLLTKALKEYGEWTNREHAMQSNAEEMDMGVRFGFLACGQQSSNPASQINIEWCW